MRVRLGRRFRPARLLVALAFAAGGIAVPAVPASAGAQVNGSGSTWSQIAIDQWRADVARQGLSVNYQGLGSTTGRNLYIQGQYDFAVSEIPFQAASYDRFGQPLYDEIQAAKKRPYAYMPIVAGGTSFMYHLEVNGKRIDDLHLSGETITKIFTGKITNWNDPAVKKDDGRQFPSIPIIPVVRSDGSGTSAQFTAYMANMYPSLWNPFCSKLMNLPSPCPPTSLYPYFGASKAQSGSDGVANFVAAPYNNGAITYVEYGYALERSFPVVSVLNAAGYYVQPTAENVAIALQAARLNPDRTQVLTGVYRNPDKRAYPISSYSYMIVPTTTASPMTADKGQTLGKFILYFVCTGQQKAKQLGYSPLPKNLVQFGFDVVKLIPGAPAPPPLDQCANPTITGGFTTTNAPPPKDTDKAGSQRPNLTGGTSNGDGGNDGGVTLDGAGGGGTGGSRGSGSGSGPTTGASGSGDASGAGGGGAGGGGGGRGGKGTTASATATGTNGDGLNLADAAPTSISRHVDGVSAPTYAFVVLVVLLAVFGPPAVALWLRRRDATTS
jgi:phosphate ABC transporter phosphate-binding protein